MDTLIPVTQREGVLVADSREIAVRLEVQHKNVLETIQAHRVTLEAEFGRVAFETETLQTAGGAQQTRFAYLAEDQALFLATLSRNKAAVVRVKAWLVKAFSEARKQLSGVPASNDPLVILQHQALQMAHTVGQLIEQRAAIIRNTADIARLDAKLELFNANTGYLTVRAFAKERGLRMPENTAKKIGVKAAALCRQRGVNIGDVPDEKYGSVHSYPVDILKEAFSLPR